MHTHVKRHILTLVFAAALAMPVVAQTVRDQLLVSPQWLQSHINTVNVLHVGDRASYDACHIPGAAFIDSSSLVVQLEGIPNELPPVNVLENVFKAAGVDARGPIVIYSTDSLLAARAWFTLDYLGQGDRTALLDGGLAKWLADGHAATDEVMVTASGSFEARVMSEKVTRRATMRRLLGLRDELGANVLLIDARSASQFCGTEAGPEVRHAGHIPGAVNVPVANNFAVSGAFRSATELRTLYQLAGVSKETINVVYCRTGMQASVTYFVLKYLGYDVTMYDGSYVEWSNTGEPTEATARLEPAAGLDVTGK
jgi:thiosulfate/3-mercaptopyruvate sulfurtransferase